MEMPDGFLGALFFARQKLPFQLKFELAQNCGTYHILEDSAGDKSMNTGHFKLWYVPQFVKSPILIIRNAPDDGGKWPNW